MGDTFYLDTLSFKKCVPTDGRDLLYDTGNIIFNNGESSDPCGVYWTQADLTTQGDFFYDASTWTVKLYSTTNPASITPTSNWHSGRKRSGRELRDVAEPGLALFRVKGH